MKSLCLTLLIIVASTQAYRKITHDKDENAKCLDGSPAALYLHEGNPRQILFYLQGGGVCGANSLSETLESCYQRSKTIYGSSLYWPETATGEGILSTDPAKDIFANWTKVIMIYCDGAFHQGMANEPYSYKDTKLYFRGAANTRSHIQYIHNRFNLTKAESVILSGSSAGGIAALAWESLFKSYATTADFRVVADSAVLLRIDVSELSNIFKLSNADESVPNKDCGSFYGKELEWRCLTFQGILPFVRTKILFLQSAYDSFIISQRLYFNCLSEGEYGYSLSECSPGDREAIEDYRREYLDYIGQILSYGHSIWSIDCALHSFVNFDRFYSSPSLKVPMTFGRTMEQAVYAWSEEKVEVAQIDLDGWPNNKPCAQ